MLAAGLRRDEHFDRLPHKLIARIAKNALCLKIDHFDSAGAIDHDKHIRRRFHDVLKPFQAVPELVFHGITLRLKAVFYPWDKSRRGRPEQELLAAAAQNRFEDEGWRIRKDGSRFWAHVVITAMRDEAHRAAGGAIIKNLAGVQRHLFRLCGSAMRAGNDGLDNHHLSENALQNRRSAAQLSSSAPKDSLHSCWL
jgi:hypothetical protein